MLRSALQRLVIISGLIAITIMVVLCASVPWLWSLSLVELFAGTLGLFVIALTIQWAIRSEEIQRIPEEIEPISNDPVEQNQGDSDLENLVTAQRINSRFVKPSFPSPVAARQPPDSPASTLPPRPLARDTPPLIDFEEPILPDRLITPGEPIVPHRTRSEARTTANLATDLILDFDAAAGAARITLDLEPSEGKPPIPLPVSSQAKPAVAATRAEIHKERPIDNVISRDSSPIKREAESGRKVSETRQYKEPIKVIDAKTATDQGEVIPRRLSVEVPSHVLYVARRLQVEAPRPQWSPPRNVESLPDTAVLTWHGSGQSISVGPYTLTDPLVYVCDGQRSSSEASCIDRRHAIGKAVAELVGSLGYYPEYSRLSPDQRANYLQWLANGRTGPMSDIGYAFLYFYGLERRLLIDDQDLSPIVKEVVRLLEVYTFSGSFDGYLSRFLSYTLARTGIGTLKEKWFQAVFERTRAQRDEQHLAVGLAWLFSNERPLPPEWACRIARLDPRSPRSVVLERLPDQFNALFLKRYKDRYGDGMKLTAAKRDREVTYQPASPSRSPYTSSSTELKPVKIPHVMGIQSQFAPLVKIWTSCVEELKPLSRVMAKGADVSNRAAYEALPEELKAETEHPDKSRWDQVGAEQAQEDGTVLVKIGKQDLICISSICKSNISRHP